LGGEKLTDPDMVVAALLLVCVVLVMCFLDFWVASFSFARCATQTSSGVYVSLPAPVSECDTTSCLLACILHAATFSSLSPKVCTTYLE